jgi:hypothetical protein
MLICQYGDFRKNMPNFQVPPQLLERQRRLDDALNLRKPDRVPVAPVNLHYYPTRVKGITNKESMYHWENRLVKIKEVTIQHHWDAASACRGWGGSTLGPFRVSAGKVAG